MVALALGDELSRLDDPEGLNEREGLDELDGLDDWNMRRPERAFVLTAPGERRPRGRRGYLQAAYPTAPARRGAARRGTGRRRARSRKFFWRRLLVLCALSVLGVVAWGATEEVFGAPGASPAGLEACLSPAAASHSVDLAAASSGSPSGASSAGATVSQVNLTVDGASACPQTYVARPGDTIWAIAARFSGGGDPRPLAAELEAEIGGANLQPGQVLALPAAAPLHR